MMTVRNATKEQVKYVLFPNGIVVRPELRVEGPMQVTGIFNASGEIREAGNPITPATFTFTPDVMLVQADSSGVATPDRLSDIVDLFSGLGLNRTLTYDGYASTDAEIVGEFTYRNRFNALTAVAGSGDILYNGDPLGESGVALAVTGSEGTISFYSDIGKTDEILKLEFDKNSENDLRYRCLALGTNLSGSILKTISVINPVTLKTKQHNFQTKRVFVVKKLMPGSAGAAGPPGPSVIVTAQPPVVTVQSDSDANATPGSGDFTSVSANVGGTQYTFDEPTSESEGPNPTSSNSFSIDYGPDAGGGSVVLNYSDGTSTTIAAPNSSAATSTTVHGSLLTGILNQYGTGSSSNELAIFIDTSGNTAKVIVVSIAQTDSTSGKTIISATVTLNAYLNIGGTVTSSPGIPVSFQVVKNIPIDPLIVTTAPETIVVPASSSGVVSVNTQFATISATRGSTNLEVVANYDGTVSMDDRLDLNVDGTNDVTGTSTDVSGNTRALGSQKSGTDLLIKDGSVTIATFALSTSGSNLYVLTLTQMATNDGASNELASIQINIPYLARVAGENYTGTESLSVLKNKQGSDGAAGLDGTDATTVSLAASTTQISYNSAGTGRSVTSITLAAASQNFTDAYFKFTGGGSAFTDEVSFTDGTGANSDTATFSVPTNYSSTPYTFTVQAREGSTGTPIVSDTIAISSVKPGADGSDGTPGGSGTDATTVSLTASTTQISYNSAGSGRSVSSITLTATSQNFTDAYFKFTGGGSAFTDEVSFTDGTGANSDTATFSVPVSYSSTPYTFTVEAREGSTGTPIVSDTVTISSVKPGTDGDPGESPITVTVTPENVIVPASSSGIPTSLAGTGAKIQVSQGSTQYTVHDSSSPNNSTFRIASSFDVSDTNVTAPTFNGTNYDQFFGNPFIDVANITAFSAGQDTGFIDYTVTIRSTAGTTLTVDVRQTFTKSFSGIRSFQNTKGHATSPVGKSGFLKYFGLPGSSGTNTYPSSTNSMLYIPRIQPAATLVDGFSSIGSYERDSTNTHDNLPVNHTTTPYPVLGYLQAMSFDSSGEFSYSGVTHNLSDFEGPGATTKDNIVIIPNFFGKTSGTLESISGTINIYTSDVSSLETYKFILYKTNAAHSSGPSDLIEVSKISVQVGALSSVDSITNGVDYNIGGGQILNVLAADNTYNENLDAGVGLVPCLLIENQQKEQNLIHWDWDLTFQFVS